MRRHFLLAAIVGFIVFTTPVSGAEEYCSEGLIRAMRENGLNISQIKAVCDQAKRYDQAVGIRGMIVDASEQPVAGIEVLIKDSGLKTRSQKDGSFQLPANSGNIEITFSSLELPQSYLPKPLTVDSVKEDCYPKWRDVGVLTLSVTVLECSDTTIRYASTDGRFIHNGDGTVSDTKTGLTWAAKDNGYNLNWPDAKKFCENFRAGGYTDWRLPSVKELAGIYDPRKKNRLGYHVTDFIDIAYSPWAAETRGLKSAFFHFGAGKAVWYPQSESLITRALPVRNSN